MLKEKGFIKLRWLLLLGLLAGGVIVYAKENPSTFLTDSPASSPQVSSGPTAKVENTVEEIKNSLKKLSKSESVNDKEIRELGEPETITKKDEANFYEAAFSEISQSKENVSGKVSATLNCIEEANKNNQ